MAAFKRQHSRRARAWAGSPYSTGDESPQSALIIADSGTVSMRSATFGTLKIDLRADEAARVQACLKMND